MQRVQYVPCKALTTACWTNQERREALFPRPETPPSNEGSERRPPLREPAPPPPPLQQKRRGYRTKECFYHFTYRKGGCRKGDRCEYSHERLGRGPAKSVPVATALVAAPALAAAGPVAAPAVEAAGPVAAPAVSAVAAAKSVAVPAVAAARPVAAPAVAAPAVAAARPVAAPAVAAPAVSAARPVAGTSDSAGGWAVVGSKKGDRAARTLAGDRAARTLAGGTAKRIRCRNCGAWFCFAARDQEFHARQGWAPPKRCKACRKKQQGGRACSRR